MNIIAKLFKRNISPPNLVGTIFKNKPLEIKDLEHTKRVHVYAHRGTTAYYDTDIIIPEYTGTLVPIEFSLSAIPQNLLTEIQLTFYDKSNNAFIPTNIQIETYMNNASGEGLISINDNKIMVYTTKNVSTYHQGNILFAIGFYGTTKFYINFLTQ